MAQPAEGLQNRLQQFQQNRMVRDYEIISEEDKLLKLWETSSQGRFSKLEFFRLLRKTVLYALSSLSIPHVTLQDRKKNLLRKVAQYFHAFSNVLKNNSDFLPGIINAIMYPWTYKDFKWEALLEGKISFKDEIVQNYLEEEPEEVFLARVHHYYKLKMDVEAMVLAKCSFFYHTRVTKNLSSNNTLNYKQKSQSMSVASKYRKGLASLDWYLHFLKNYKSLPAIIHEINQLTCHEGVLLIQRLRRSRKNQEFIFTVLHILLMRELVQSSNYCCTKKIFSLWCIMHKEKRTSDDNISKAIRKFLAPYAPSSAHFYLFADALWEQFGSHLITLYVELYVRGLTTDLNHYEVAKFSDDHDDVTYLESHIASILAKLSTLFSDFHEGAARECMFSAFSLKPTKERLYILQSLTHSILSAENEMKVNCSSVNSTLQECKCDIQCDGSCKSTKDFSLEHPLLKKGISNVPFMLVKDLVTVLEGVRCFNFQYNIFDWHNNATDLGDYLKDFNLTKSWELDTEYASEGSNKSDTEDDSFMYESTVNESLPNGSPYISAHVNDKSLNLSVKRKNVDRDLFSLDIGANIEVGNGENLSKRAKIGEQRAKQGVENTKTLKSLGTSMGMEDAIENVIRMTLDKDKQNLDLLLNNNNFLNTSLSHTNDGTENLSLSSVNNHMPKHHVIYPYSLTSQGKMENLSSDFKVSECLPFGTSSISSRNKCSVNFVSESSVSNHILASPVSRESVISPNIEHHKRIINMQEKTLKQLGQKKLFSAKPVPVPTYCHTKSNLSPSIDSNKKVPLYQPRTADIGPNNSYDLNRNNQNPTVESTQYISNKTTMQVLQKSGISRSSDFPKAQRLLNASISAPHSVTSPVNVIQTKETLAVQRSTFPPTSHCLSRSDSGFHYTAHNSVNNTIVRRVAESVSCFQDNQLVHCDRSSVIQHTMQHVRENPTREVNDVEMPSRLTVSINSNAVEQIRCTPKEDIANLPPFTVNVTDKTVTNSALKANLVISRKPQQQTEASIHSVAGELTPVSSNNPIVIEGVLCSPSVIVSPWEAQHKSHGELSYKKSMHVLNPTSIDKRIYKNRLPYSKPVLSKQDPKAIRPIISSDKIRNSQGLKGIVSASHIRSSATHPSLKQNQPNASHAWSLVNKLPTSATPQSTSSQPWYSEPYPKPYNSSNAAKSSGNTTTAEQSMLSLLQSVQPVTQNSSKKMSTAYSKQNHQNKDDLLNILTVPVTVSHSLNNPVPSSTKSSVLSNVSSSSTNQATHPLLKKAIVHKDFTSVSFSTLQPNTTAKTLSVQCNPVNSSMKPSSQYANVSQYSPSLIQEKSPAAFSPANVDANLQYGHISEDFSNCCSPSEINPCQNCSLPPARVDLVQISSQKNEDKSAEQSLQTNNKMVCKGLTSTAVCDSEHSGDAAGAMLSNIEENFVLCQYCSHSFPAPELEMHVLNSHSKEEISGENDKFNVGPSPKIPPENTSTSFKSLPDVVPEQDSLFQREPIQDNLPQARSFENPVVDQSIAEDVKNLDPAAFNACMDLINSDKDLKRIVQGIDPFNQMENDYLPFIPPTDSTDNFINSDICSEVPKTNIEAPLQQLGVSDKGGEFNNFSVKCDPSHVEAIKLNPEKSQGVFEFTEKDYEASKPAQKLIHSKAQTPCSENVNSSKTSNGLTFADLAEMIKVSMTGGNEVIESDELKVESKVAEENISHNISASENSELVSWNCSYCLKKLNSNRSLKRHVHKLHPHISVDDFKSNLSSKLSDVGSLGDSSESNALSANEGVNNPVLDDISANSAPVESSNSLTPVTNSNTNQNTAFPVAQFGPALPKGRVKGIIKSPTSQCNFCGKMLTSVYMKKHILKQHSEISVKVEKSSSELNDDVNKSSLSQVDASNFTAVSTLPDQDIDSSTCLSVSDALKRSTSYTIADASNISSENDKLSENMNIKFNFHVLELSNENKVDSKVPVTAENKDLLSAVEPSNSPIIKTELDNNIKVNVTYSKKSGFVLQRHICSFCSKGYTGVAGLNKHLRTVHQVVDIPRNRRKSKKFDKLNDTNNDIQNLEKTPPLSSVNSQNVIVPKTEPLDISDNNEMVAQFPEQVSHTSKLATPHLITYLKKKNLNGSLLRSVLQSNFKSKQLEMQDSGGTEEAVHSQENEMQLSVDPLAKTSNNDIQLACLQSSAAKCLDSGAENGNLKIESSDTQTSDKNSASVPSEICLQSQEVDDSSRQIPDAITHTPPLVSSKVNSCLDNILHGTDKNLQLPHTPCGINSQNLSIQSNEISSVSEIISNVSKCQFVSTSNKDINEKELYEDNSLKLLIPENQQETKNITEEKDSIVNSIVSHIRPEQQESNVDDESKSVNTCDDSNLSVNKISEDLTVTNPEDSEAETVESKSEGLTAYEEQSMPFSSENGSNKKCRLCHQNLSSIDSLSKHLKDVHDIPVLKKHISELYSVKHSKYSHESVKLSPPKLRLGTNESDSESVSDFESARVNLKVTDSAEPCTTKNSEIVYNLGLSCPVPSENHANENVKNLVYSACSLKSMMQSANTESKTQPKQPNLISSVCSISNSNSLPNPATSPCKYKFRRHSFSDKKSFFTENKSLLSNEFVHLVSSNFDFRNAANENLKCDSLTNFQVALRCESTSLSECKLDKTNTSVKNIDFLSQNNAECPKETDVAAEHSSGRNESFSSVTNSTEISKTCDTVSQNCSIEWDAVTIDSGFLLSNSVLNPPVSKPSHTQLSARKKMSRRFKIFEKIKTYKKQKRMKKRVKAKYFTCHKKLKSRKAFKPLILTLKEATEISEFLKTHKQPMVNLIRLKEENYSNILLSKESCPIGNKYCMKEAVVKLERIPIPSSLNHVIFIDPKVVSDLISDNSQFDSLSMQNQESQSIDSPDDFCLGSSSTDLSHSKLSTIHLNPPMESIDFSDTIDLSSDTASGDADQNIMIEEKCSVKTDECCSVPLVKKCFVVLERLSI